MTLQSPEFEAVSFGADMHPHLRGKTKKNKSPESTGSLHGDDYWYLANNDEQIW